MWKKIGLIAVTLAGFFVVERLVLTPFRPALRHLVHGNVTVNLLVEAVLELIMLLLFVWLNRRFIKQKLLFEHYHFGKGFGLMWYSWLLILSAAVTWGVGRLTYSPTFGFLLTALIYAVLVGCAEELIFRGMILGQLVAQKMPIWLAVLISSVLFGCTHLINLTHNSFYNVGLQVLYAIPLGAFLALLYVKSNNLVYPILAHAIQDFAAFVISGGKLDSTGATPQTVIQLYVIFGIIVFLYYITGKKQRLLFENRLRRENLISVGADKT